MWGFQPGKGPSGDSEKVTPSLFDFKATKVECVKDRLPILALCVIMIREEGGIGGRAERSVESL